jgi:hypothetical protein
MPAQAQQQGNDGKVVEEVVEHDLAGMSAEERRAAVAADAPELAALLAELQGALAEVRGRVGPLLAEVRPRFNNQIYYLLLFKYINQERRNKKRMEVFGLFHPHWQTLHRQFCAEPIFPSRGDCSTSPQGGRPLAGPTHS